MSSHSDPSYLWNHPRELSDAEREAIKSESRRLYRNIKKPKACRKGSAVHALTEAIKKDLQRTNRPRRPLGCKVETWERACLLLAMDNKGHYATPTDETLQLISPNAEDQRRV
jgi:hypothetical protein